MNRVTITIACAIVAVLVGCEQPQSQREHRGPQVNPPAVHVGTVHEDGSFTFSVKDATCSVPNTDEERTTFNVACTRSPNTN